MLKGGIVSGIGLRQLCTLYIKELKGIPSGTPYHVLPVHLCKLEQQARDRSGDRGLMRLRVEVLSELIRSKPIPALYLATEEVNRLCVESFARIQAHCQNEIEQHYLHYKDQYLKDLALCRGIMFPAGARIVETHMGFSRSIVAKGGLAQRLRFLSLLTALRSNRPVFQLHVHPDDLAEFNESGWRRTLGRLARMLVANPDTLAVSGSSWLYDPDLINVSPRLAYISVLSRRAGVRLFHLGADTTDDAFARSPTRRRLANEGKYYPQRYAAIWPRKELIARCADW